MQPAPEVRFELGASRSALGAIGAGVAACCAVVLTLPWLWVVKAIVLCGILAWGGRSARVVALRLGPRAVRGVVVAEGRRIGVSFGDGRTRRGSIELATRVTSRVTTVVWRPDGALASRSLLILPDMLAAEEFRRLRVLLRYGRSELTQGAPASQA